MLTLKDKNTDNDKCSNCIIRNHSNIIAAR